MISKPVRFPLTPFHLTGMTTILALLILGFIDLRLTVFPPALFALLCLAAPFFQQFSFFLPIITHGDRKKRTVALTFDDGPDPQTTPALLKLLSKYSVKACFFVIGSKAELHPELIADIVSQGHEIGNHSYNHDPILMLRSSRTLYQEIADCQTILKKQGIDTFAFRPPVGITNPKLLPVLSKLEMFCLGFSCRPVDFGNRRIKHLKTKVLKKVKAGDIIMLHDRQYGPDSSVNMWFRDMEGILKGIQEKNLEIIPLSRLIEKPTMQSCPQVIGSTASK